MCSNCDTMRPPSNRHFWTKNFWRIFTNSFTLLEVNIMCMETGLWGVGENNSLLAIVSLIGLNINCT